MLIVNFLLYKILFSKTKTKKSLNYIWGHNSSTGWEYLHVSFTPLTWLCAASLLIIIIINSDCNNCCYLYVYLHILRSAWLTMSATKAQPYRDLSGGGEWGETLPRVGMPIITESTNLLVRLWGGVRVIASSEWKKHQELSGKGSSLKCVSDTANKRQRLVFKGIKSGSLIFRLWLTKYFSLSKYQWPRIWLCRWAGRGYGRVGLRMSGMWPYLVETVADAAQLGWKFAGRTNDGLEEALGDLQEVPLVLLQVLTLFQPNDVKRKHVDVCIISDDVWMKKKKLLKQQ